MPIANDLIAAGAACYGTCPDKLTLLWGGGAGSDSVVYKYQRDGREWTLKFKPGDADTVRSNDEKLAFTLYLAECGVQVARPQASLNGKLTELLVGRDQSFILSSEQVIAGRHIDARNASAWDATFFTRWGALIGQMHSAAEAYPCWRKHPLDNLESAPIGIMDWEDEWHSFNTWCQEDAVRVRWHELYDQLTPLPIERDGFGLIHNDPHPWNMLYDGSQLTMIDFEVASYSWFMMDLGIAIYAALWQTHPTYTDYAAYAAGFLESFLAGYRSQHALATYWLEKLPLFINYRRILLFIVMYAELKKHMAIFEQLKRSIIENTPVLPPDMQLC